VDASSAFALAYLHIRLHMSCTEEESEFQHSLGCSSSSVQSQTSKQTNKQAFVLALQRPNLGDVELRLLLPVSHAATQHGGSRNIHTCLAWINFNFTGRNGCLGSGEDAAKPKSLELPLGRKAL
jgi:hypothetical protein